jgi:hypothetical protein
MTRRVLVGAVAAGFCVAGGAGAVVRSAGADATGAPPAAPQTRSAGEIYRVFRTPPARFADSAVATRAESLAGRAISPDPAFTRFLGSTAHSRVVAVVGSGSVCLHVEQAVPAGERPSWGGSGCARLADPVIAREPVAGTTVIGRGRWQFTALVPDGIESLRLETAAGPQVLDVVDNAVAIELDSKPTGLSWTTADGTSGSGQPWLDG